MLIHTLKSLLAAMGTGLLLTAAHPARAADPGIGDGAITLGMSAPFSGPNGAYGKEMREGALAYFAQLNGAGGINGKKIELVTLDDGYETDRTVANTRKLIDENKVFALMAYYGSSPTTEAMKLFSEAKTPLLGTISGAGSLRSPVNRYMFHLRASYADEAERLVQHLATIGIQRIGIAYQNNTFGREVFTGAEAAMRRAKLPDAIATTVESNAADAAKAAALLAESNPEAVLVGLAGKPGLEFIKEFRKLRRGVSLYALSVLGTSANIKALGADALGMAISQVVPLPTNSSTAVARDFVKALKNFDAQATPSHLALEGYINARTFAEILQRAGKGASRSAFMDASWGLKKWDLGGFEIHATTPDRSASRFVELTVVGRDGRLMR